MSAPVYNLQLADADHTLRVVGVLSDIYHAFEDLWHEEPWGIERAELCHLHTYTTTLAVGLTTVLRVANTTTSGKDGITIMALFAAVEMANNDRYMRVLRTPSNSSDRQCAILDELRVHALQILTHLKSAIPMPSIFLEGEAKELFRTSKLSIPILEMLRVAHEKSVVDA